MLTRPTKKNGQNPPGKGFWPVCASCVATVYGGCEVGFRVMDDILGPSTGQPESTPSPNNMGVSSSKNVGFQPDTNLLVNPTISRDFPVGVPWDANVKPNEFEGFIDVDLFRVDAVVIRSYRPKCAGTVSERGAVGSVPSRDTVNNLVHMLNNCSPQMLSMMTFTMTPDCNAIHSVKQHLQVREAITKRLKWCGITDYVWVREFQRNKSVHWHFFVPHLFERQRGDVDLGATRDWSEWFAKAYQKKRLLSDRDYNHMAKRSCQVEVLRELAAGRYTAKEGAKRFQKLAPEKWANGGLWWGHSRSLTVPVVERVRIPVKDLACAEVNLSDGRVIDVPFRIQFSMGLKRLGSS